MSILPARPVSRFVEGTYRDAGGMAIQVRGQLTLSIENQVSVDGSGTILAGGQLYTPSGGAFEGRLDDGTMVNIAHAVPGGLNLRTGGIGSGRRLELAALGSVEWSRPRASHHEPIETDLVITWLITHSPLLWQTAKHFHYYPWNKLTALGLDAGRVSPPRPNVCRWTLDSVDFEIAFHEEKFPMEDAVTHYPVSSTRYVPRVEARISRVLTGPQLLDEVERAQVLLGRLLSCLGFLEGAKVLGYERSEKGEVVDPTPPHRRGYVHQAVRTWLGRIPEPPPDNRVRSHVNGDLFATQAETMVSRLAAGEPFTSAAVDTYLLALDSHDGPSRLLLLSTALESLKELFLRSRPQTGLVAEVHWRAIRTGLEKHLSGSLWREEYGSSDLRGQMKAKMGELNRPSYKQTIQDMIGAWGVSMEGLDDPLAFIEARNLLVHTGQVRDGDYDRLARVTTVLQALFERLMAAALGLHLTDFQGLGGI